jgi:hypothetical protein
MVKSKHSDRGHTEGTYLGRLRRAPGLSDAAVGELRAVARVAEFLTVASGTQLAGGATRWRGVYLVVDGSAVSATPKGVTLVGSGDTITVSDDEAQIVAVSAITLVAIPEREWRALRALAPGVVRAIDALAAVDGPAPRAGRDVHAPPTVVAPVSP